MKECALCRQQIPSGTEAVSIAGGLFPREDPDFFAMDEGVLKESYAHLKCLLTAVEAFADKGGR